MNRRGFFGLLGKLAQVGMAMGIAPELLAPIQEVPVNLCLKLENEPELACSPGCELCEALYQEGHSVPPPTWTLAS